MESSPSIFYDDCSTRPNCCESCSLRCPRAPPIPQDNYEVFLFQWSSISSLPQYLHTDFFSSNAPLDVLEVVTVSAHPIGPLILKLFILLLEIN